MRAGFKAFFIHFFVTIFFVFVALAYFSPTLQGKVMFQNDIAQYTGMAKEQNDFRKKTGEEPYWTNSAFGGMPTYQLGANYPYNYVKKLDRIIRFLPRPADYLFLYFIGFYILLCCMKIDYRLAIIGALAYGFSTYLIIIFGAGHNAKAHALAYLPIILGGILLVFQKKYLWGFLLTGIAMALEVSANHYQMTYYFMLLVIILGAVYLVDAIKKNEIKKFSKATSILFLAVFLGIAANATGILATKEYTDWSTRGSSELTINSDGTAKENKGLSKAYITQWSYGITESLNLFVPRLFGGSSRENLGKDSKAYNYLLEKGLSPNSALEFSKGIPLYWGDQPGTSGPAYIGAIIFFLCILGLILVKRREKCWLLGGVIMSLLLSWGHNFSLLTNFMINYFPLYDKFRAVSSIQVILELCAPILGILALAAIFNSSIEKSKKVRALKISFFSVLGIGLILFIVKGMFDFESPSDANMRMQGLEELPNMIQSDRKRVYTNDLFRSLIFVITSAALIWGYLKDKLKQNMAIMAIGVLIVFDLVGVDLRYVNDDNFVSKRKMTHPFQETELDQFIAKDTTIYRVFDPSDSGARTSFFHQSIGGYHAAKPAAYQDLYDFYISKFNLGVLNMLNVKYIIQQDEEGRSYPAINPDANGNAWFVEKIKQVKSADDELLALEKINTKTEAVLNTKEVSALHNFSFQIDSTASIVLTEYIPNHLTYVSNNSNLGVAVFSEMYYAHGWNAYIDGTLKEHFKANYALRALEVPKGEHTIEFKFEPAVVKTGSHISLLSSLLLGFVLVGGIVFSFWRSKKKEKEHT